MTLGVLAAVPAAPLLPAISTLGAVLAFALAFALSVMWFQILRGPLVRLAKVGILRVHPFGWLNTVVTNVDNWINATVAGTERAVTWSFHELMWCISTGTKLLEDATRATYQALEWERRHTTRHVSAPVPQSISPRLKTLEKEYRGIDARRDQMVLRVRGEKAAGAAAGTIDHAQLARGIDKLTKEFSQIAQHVHDLEHAQSHAGAKAKPGARAIPRTKPRAVPRTRSTSRHWTDVLTKAAAVGIGLYALARLGLSWARCTNVKRAGKVLCGMNPDFLNSLLGASLLLTSGISLRDLARELEQPTELVADALHKLIKEF